MLEKQRLEIWIRQSLKKSKAISSYEERPIERNDCFLILSLIGFPPHTDLHFSPQNLFLHSTFHSPHFFPFLMWLRLIIFSWNAVCLHSEWKVNKYEDWSEAAGSVRSRKITAVKNNCHCKCKQSERMGAVVVAQLVERSLPTPEIRGSNLDCGKILSASFYLPIIQWQNENKEK